jgi:uncharacterized protein (TIGR02145 family)
VQIGDQCWFAENLRTELYSNADAIPGGLTDGEWGSTTEGAQAVYNNDAPNLSDYGRLYNWYAVDDTRGLCPSGWHVPTDDEWTDLESFIIGQGIMDTGNALKSTLGWDTNFGTDDFGYNAKPSGERATYGLFSNIGLVATWWSASGTGENAWRRWLQALDPMVNKGFHYAEHGFSVRCLKDTE